MNAIVALAARLVTRIAPLAPTLRGLLFALALAYGLLSGSLVNAQASAVTISGSAASVNAGGNPSVSDGRLALLHQATR